jgi:hypothetical protein
LKVASVLDAEFDDASADVTLKWYVVAHDNPDTINECAVTNAALEILAPYDAVAPESTRDVAASFVDQLTVADDCEGTAATAEITGGVVSTVPPSSGTIGDAVLKK